MSATIEAASKGGKQMSAPEAMRWLGGMALAAAVVAGTVCDYQLSQNYKHTKSVAYERGVDEGESYGVCWTWATVAEAPRYPKQAQADAGRCIDELQTARLRNDPEASQ